MNVAVIPVKRLTKAKTRLASVLDEAQRSELALELLRRTVGAIKKSGAIDALALVTCEIGLGNCLEVEVVPGGDALNEDLSSSVEWARGLAADSLLILPADLPLIEPSDVAAILHAAANVRPGVSITRTRDGGTGALLLSPPNVIPPMFGADSFRLHMSAARDRGIQVERIKRSALEFDLDTVADLACSDLSSRYLPATKRVV